ncbi:hypothetical protein STCU_10553 [Strigomonas culicis]|uniref:Uncharacterized protein n=1 Tax=Strigomonas culicis TaxID=28005 RepID=S9TMH3_9TRYP|nr:hypothetical protein STCU_10553 [Strigomonas culicis]|eukprot:EPY17533.1 hypothetical protein STCU_10553 [Strigomonas culicis]
MHKGANRSIGTDGDEAYYNSSGGRSSKKSSTAAGAHHHEHGMEEAHMSDFEDMEDEAVLPAIQTNKSKTASTRSKKTSKKLKKLELNSFAKYSHSHMTLVYDGTIIRGDQPDWTVVSLFSPYLSAQQRKQLQAHLADDMRYGYSTGPKSRKKKKAVRK